MLVFNEAIAYAIDEAAANYAPAAIVDAELDAGADPPEEPAPEMLEVSRVAFIVTLCVVSAI